ncbi:MAG: BA14K family protein [Rhizobiaceae bacterium]
MVPSGSIRPWRDRWRCFEQRGAWRRRALPQYCHNRWRSYRASDNTYQPTNGPRCQCVSRYS